jgi:hypothetical protein
MGEGQLEQRDVLRFVAELVLDEGGDVGLHSARPV